MRGSFRVRGRYRAPRPRFEVVVLLLSLALVISQSIGLLAASALGPGSFSSSGSTKQATTAKTSTVKAATTKTVQTSTARQRLSQSAVTTNQKATRTVTKSRAPRVANTSLGVNLDQYANGGTTASASWVNGDLNQHNAAYHEGDVVPFRLAIEGLTTGSHTIHINYDFTAGGHEAYDFLATWNVTENPGLCESGGGGVSSACPTLGSADTKAFPSDSFAPGSPTHSGLTVAGAESFSGVSRNLTMYGGTITSITGPTHSGPVGGNSTGDFVVTFNATRSGVLFAWGGHLAESAYWVTTGDQPNGAATISGAPWHMRTQNLDGSGNKNQDRSIQPGAIVPLPGLTILKTADSSSVPAGDPIGFTITVTNTGNVGLSNVALTDQLPGGAGIDWSIQSTTGSPTCSISGSPPNETLNCTKNPLASSASFTVHVTSPTSDAGCLKYDNTATVSADNVPDASSSDSVTLTGCAPGLTITKAASSNSVPFSTAFTYTVTVKNTGNAQATGVVVTDDMPDSLTGVSASFDVDPGSAGGTGTCSVGAGNTVTCNVGTLAANDGAANGPDEVVVTINATTPNTCGELSNTATVDSDQTSPVSSTAAVITVTGCAPGLSITKDGPASVTSGDTITYTVTVQNSGNADATGVIVTDNLDDSLSNVAGSFNQSTCSVGANPLDSNDQNFVTCNLGTVARDTSVVITITGDAPASICETVQNQATVVDLGGEGQSVTSNLVTTDVTDCPIGIQVVKGGPALAHIGDTVEYSFDVSLKDGTIIPLHDITLTDPRCNSAPTLVSKTGGNQDDILEPGETWSYTCSHVVTASDPDPLVNTATVTGTAPDERQTSDQDTHQVDIIHPAIQIVKSASPTSVGPGATVTYTYEVTNVGDVNLFDVVVTDNKLGAICTIPELDVNASHTCTKTFVTPQLGGPIDNVATATGHDETGFEVTDTDTATIQVVLGTTVTPPPTTSPPSGVAFTGAAGVVPWALLSLLLLIAGSGILFLTRRRRGQFRA
jgi:uncharacterized repeat protein (TIGR01451 family)